MQGYIKDYRKEIESDVWLMPPLYHRIWQWLKYNVNHDDATIPMRDGTSLQIKRGQRLTSIRDLAKSVGWYEGVKWKEPNPKTVSVILEWMESKSMISIERGQGNRQYTLITLIKWDVYNPKVIQGNSSETVGKHLVDINNNDLNDFNDLYIATTTGDEFKNVFDAYCEIHGKAEYQAYSQSTDIQRIIDKGVPSSTIISVMRDKHKYKTSRGENVSGFSYYEAAIIEAWEGGKRLAEHEGSTKGVRSGGYTPTSASESITGGQLGWIGKRNNVVSLPNVQG